MKFKRFKYISFILSLSMLFFGIYIKPVLTAELIKKTIYFYNPEANINNFTSLKISFDTYLAKFNLYNFQPFDNKSVFENSIANYADGVFMLSSWHFRLLQNQLSIKPILVGVSNGKSTQRKILSVNQSINNIDQLRGKTIAVAASKSYSRSILRQIFGKQHYSILHDVTLMLVPKDIDALMAVGFGMAAAALTNDKSLETLELINSKQYNLLRPLGSSGEKFLTIVAVPQQTTASTNDLLDILKKMSATQEGKTKLKMLGLDGWKKLSQSEIDALQAEIRREPQ